MSSTGKNLIKIFPTVSFRPKFSEPNSFTKFAELGGNLRNLIKNKEKLFWLRWLFFLCVWFAFYSHLCIMETFSQSANGCCFGSFEFNRCFFLIRLFALSFKYSYNKNKVSSCRKNSNDFFVLHPQAILFLCVLFQPVKVVLPLADSKIHFFFYLKMLGRSFLMGMVLIYKNTLKLCFCFYILFLLRINCNL